MSYTATYSPEDNKVRLYTTSRLDPETYAKARALGFIYAPKQELFVSPSWSPAKEDFLIELAGEIEDEDKSLVQRAEERADRFETYSEHRKEDSEQAAERVSQITDGIPFGQPILIGHHSEKHARKDAQKIENGMRHSIKMWEQSKYWSDRAAGALHSAKYKERPDVRARRIKKLEAELRKEEKQKKECEYFLKMWKLDFNLKNRETGEIKEQTLLEKAQYVSNFCHLQVSEGIDGKSNFSAYDVLRPEEERYKNCPTMSAEEVQAIAFEKYPAYIATYDRWINHLSNRLLYERAMYQESGGMAAEKNVMQIGGAIRCWAGRGRWVYIKKINKITLTIMDNWGNGGRDFARNMPFDKITAIMNPVEIAEAREKGLISEETENNFILLTTEPPKPIHHEESAPLIIEAMKESLEAGIKTISAPQLFPTPPDIAEKMVELAEIKPGHDILEPSAGTGNIIKAMPNVRPNGTVKAVEINCELSKALEELVDETFCMDFLQCNGNLGKFDRIIMNPPFENASDIKHIEHAKTFLKPGGILVAICAGGPRQEDALKPTADYWEKLPEGSFKNQGTNVNTCLMVFKNQEIKKQEYKEIEPVQTSLF
jgi:phospholipid N-methyltransferase